MANQTEIINKALRMLKQERINSIDDDNERAAIARDLYEQSRATVCSLVDWHCLRKRVKLVKDSTPPDFGFKYSYTLPADCERVIGIQFEQDGFFIPVEHTISPNNYDYGYTYTVEGGKILTDQEKINLLYIRREDDSSKYDAMFVNVLAYHLAMEMSLPLLAEIGTVQIIEARYIDALRKAKSRNSLNTVPPAETVPFVAARY